MHKAKTNRLKHSLYPVAIKTLNGAKGFMCGCTCLKVTVLYVLHPQGAVTYFGHQVEIL